MESPETLLFNGLEHLNEFVLLNDANISGTSSRSVGIIESISNIEIQLQQYPNCTERCPIVGRLAQSIYRVRSNLSVLRTENDLHSDESSKCARNARILRERVAYLEEENGNLIDTIARLEIENKSLVGKHMRMSKDKKVHRKKLESLEGRLLDSKLQQNELQVFAHECVLASSVTIQRCIGCRNVVLPRNEDHQLMEKQDAWKVHRVPHPKRKKILQAAYQVRVIPKSNSIPALWNKKITNVGIGSKHRLCSRPKPFLQGLRLASAKTTFRSPSISAADLGTEETKIARTVDVRKETDN